MQFSLFASSLLLTLAQAITFTSPAQGALDQSKGVTVSWTTVNTDPTSAHLVLKRQAGGYPEYFYDFGNVDLSKGSYSLAGVSLPTGDAFQFAFVSVIPMNTGTLALTGQLNITGSVSNAQATLPAASSSVSVTASGAASTASGSSTGSASATSTTTVSSGATSGTASRTSSGAVATATKNAGNAQAVGGASMFALVVGAAAAMI